MSLTAYTYQAPAASVSAIQYTGSNAPDIYTAVTGGLNQARVYQTLGGSNELQIEGFNIAASSVPPNYWVVGELSSGSHLDVNLAVVDPETFATQYTAAA